MKSIILSCTPAECEKIANGDMSILVRKKVPKETPFKVFIYETKESRKRYLNDRFNSFFSEKSHYTDMGKVIGEFVCDKVDEYNFHEGLTEFNSMGLPSRIYGSYLIFADDYKSMCLSYDEVKAYGKGKLIYGLHISDLKIYDGPKELREFYAKCNIPESKCKLCDNCFEKENGYGKDYAVKKVTRPPKNYIYVEE